MRHLLSFQMMRNFFYSTLNRHRDLIENFFWISTSLYLFKWAASDKMVIEKGDFFWHRNTCKSKREVKIWRHNKELNNCQNNIWRRYFEVWLSWVKKYYNQGLLEGYGDQKFHTNVHALQRKNFFIEINQHANYQTKQSLK